MHSKIIKKLNSLYIFLIVFISNASYANAINVNEVFKKYRTSGMSEYNELNNTNILPDPEPMQFMIEVMKLILNISGILIFLGFTASGVLYILSRGEANSGMVDQAKNTAIYTTIGAVVIMVAYGIIYGITKITYN